LEIDLKKIAQVVGGEVIGEDSILVSGAGSLDEAGPHEISFFTDRRYEKSLAKTRACAILVSEKNDLFEGPQIKVPNPGLGYARVAGLFAAPVPRHPGISDRAVVNESSRIGRDVSIYPLVYVGENVCIEDHVVLFPGVFVGDRVKIGKRTVVYPNTSIWQDCRIGNDVIIHAGTVIGGDGFGFVRDGSVSVKIPQRGIVQIDDDVEIGANNCIDRAALGKTWIKRGVKTDNQVHVAHNVVIGEDSIVVAQTGISGSVRIGREVIIGGQVGIIDHLEIGDRAMVAAQSAVIKDIPPGEVVSGSPSMPHRRHLKIIREIKRLPQLNARLRHLEKKMEALEERL
jgi:UDP-3-O-[3-hydroxymyristoyl] glucosamine N-acyltransferase